MKKTNNDIYDLDSNSPNGQIGFELFKTNKHFYFHFNQEDGESILYSQAYKSKKGAENGIASVKKNIQKKEHILLNHHEDLHYFTIKAGNNQEVARSRNFDTFEDMERGLTFIYTHLGLTYESHFLGSEFNNVENNEEVAIYEQLAEKKVIEKALKEKLLALENALEDTTNALNENLLLKEEWAKEKAILKEKLVVLTKKWSDKNHSHQVEQTSIEEFQGSTYGFRIDFYNIDQAEDVKVTIFQPLSREKKVMKGLQKEAIFEFMTSRLPTTIYEKTEEETFDKIAVTSVTANSDNHSNAIATTTNHNATTETVEPAPIEKIVEEVLPENAQDIDLNEVENKVDEPTKITQEKVRSIYQMKTMVSGIGKERVSPTTNPLNSKQFPPLPSPISEEQVLQQTAEELAIIEEFFGREIKNSTKKEQNSVIHRTIEKEVPSTEDAEVEKQIIHEFFGGKIEKTTSTTPQISAEKVRKYPFNPTKSAEQTAENAVIREFFHSNPHSTADAAERKIEKMTTSCIPCSKSEDIVLFNKWFGK